jgi:hypothetical protein
MFAILAFFGVDIMSFLGLVGLVHGYFIKAIVGR